MDSNECTRNCDLAGVTSCYMDNSGARSGWEWKGGLLFCKLTQEGLFSDVTFDLRP